MLYVCGEGHSGLQKRIKAIHIDKGSDDSLPIHITEIPAAFIDINSTIAIQNTILKIGNIGLVLVDTFHKNLGNADENSGKDSAKFLQNIDLYLRSSSIAVVVVHHSGNDSNGRSRGSSSIRAAMDVEYEVKKDAYNEAPRMWGRPERFCNDYQCRRNTPTHVGKTQARAFKLKIQEKHPHACGEDCV